jgi:hypothetical protein
LRTFAARLESAEHVAVESHFGHRVIGIVGDPDGFTGGDARRVLTHLVCPDDGTAAAQLEEFAAELECHPDVARCIAGDARRTCAESDIRGRSRINSGRCGLGRHRRRGRSVGRLLAGRGSRLGGREDRRPQRGNGQQQRAQ